ncbi:MAG: DUF5706 domain-containing protein [Chitinophagaceae bacterium]
MISYPELEQKAETYTRDFIAVHPHPELTYHNLQHTRSVVDNVTLLCNHYHYDEKRENLLRIAAWFHDMGYYQGICEDNEKIGAKMAEDFLRENAVPQEDIDLVKGCIMATQMPQQPSTEEQYIICDADLAHLANPDFYEYSKQLKKELEKTKNEKIGKAQWIDSTLPFLENHRFFTSYAQENWYPKLKNNIDLLRKKKTEETEKDKEKPSKGIETMFRITSSNNQKLSSMADNKAHILISVNSIILSAIISLLLRKLEEYQYLSIPTYIILAVSVVSMIFSLVATRPNLPSGEFTEEDINDKKVNLLFFGNFYKMSLEDYTKGMEAVMDDYGYLYRSLIKDVYSQGVVLSHKYKLLHISYTVFMFGMLLSVISFIIANILHVKAII